MKTIEQLIALKNNPYYVFSPEEQATLDAFLYKKSVQQNPQQSNSSDSEKNIPATVLNKNVVQKETGEIPTINNVIEADDVNTPSDDV